jgi:hypothetical protein
MQTGSRVQVKAHKSDGTCYCWWTATVEAIEPGLVVVTTPVGHPVSDADGDWSCNYAIRYYYWLDGYRRIHARYGEYGHCLIYQEVGTLINAFRFAKGVGNGICIQVSQGNDTASFGATAGSILGAYFGPESLEERWLAPFNDDLRTGLARFWDAPKGRTRSLSKVAKRMGELPKRIAAEII